MEYFFEIQQNADKIPLCIQKRLAEKFFDAKLVITCQDKTMERKVNRLIVSNLSPFFEKLFEFESFILDSEGLRVYKLTIPFHSKSVEMAIDCFYEKSYAYELDTGLENILTLNYLNLPASLFEKNMLASFIVQAEKLYEFECHSEKIKDQMTQLYLVLDQYQIMEEKKTKNLKQRIEYLTEFQTIESIDLTEGFQVIEPNHKYKIVILSGNKNMNNNHQIEFEDDHFKYLVSTEWYAAYAPSKHVFYGISVRNKDEEECLSLDDVYKINKNTTSPRNVHLQISVYNGLDDPLINGKIFCSKYKH